MPREKYNRQETDMDEDTKDMEASKRDDGDGGDDGKKSEKDGED